MARALTLIGVLVLIGLFALINWTTFTALTPISLGITTVEAPLGLIMLGLLFVLSLLFTMWAISLQAGTLMEARRHTKELQAQRELADKAEASRFVELREFLATELERVRQAPSEAQAGVISRLERVQEELRVVLEQQSNSLAAAIGELDDRLKRIGALPLESGARGDSTPPLLR